MRYVGTDWSAEVVPIPPLRWYRFMRYDGTVSPILSRDDISVAFLDDYGSIPFDKTVLNVFFTKNEISVIEEVLLARALKIGKCYSYLLQNENLVIDRKGFFLSDKEYLDKILDYVNQ